MSKGTTGSLSLAVVLLLLRPFYRVPVHKNAPSQQAHFWLLSSRLLQLVELKDPLRVGFIRGSSRLGWRVLRPVVCALNQKRVTREPNPSLEESTRRRTRARRAAWDCQRLPALTNVLSRPVLPVFKRPCVIYRHGFSELTPVVHSSNFRHQF